MEFNQQLVIGHKGGGDDESNDGDRNSSSLPNGFTDNMCASGAICITDPTQIAAIFGGQIPPWLNPRSGPEEGPDIVITSTVSQPTLPVGIQTSPIIGVQNPDGFGGDIIVNGTRPSASAGPTGNQIICVIGLVATPTVVAPEVIELGIGLAKREAGQLLWRGAVRGGVRRVGLRGIVIAAAAVGADFAFNNGRASKYIFNWMCPAK